MASAASRRDVLPIDEGDRAVGAADPVDAVAADALRDLGVLLPEEELPVAARPVLHKLVDREGRVVVPHEVARGVAPGAELRNPGPVLRPDLGLGPPLVDLRGHLRVGRLSAVTAGAHQPLAEMNVVDDLGEVEVPLGTAPVLADPEEDLVRHVGVRVAEDAVVRKDQLGLPVVEVEREKSREVGRGADHSRGGGRKEELLRVARKLAEVGAGLFGEDRFSLLLREEELLESLGPGGLDDVARAPRRRARQGPRGWLSLRPGRVRGSRERRRRGAPPRRRCRGA